MAGNNIDAMLLISAVAILIQMILLIGFYYLKNKTDFTNLRFDLNVTKNIFSYSSVNFVITVLFFLVMRVDIYFVEKYCNKIDLSNYLQAAKIGQMLLVLPGLLAGVIFPYTIEAPKVLAGKVAYLCRTLSFFYLLILFVFILTGRFVFTWLLGPDFNLMFTVFATSFFGVYCLSISLLFISYFTGLNKQKIIIKALLVTLIIMIITNYLFVPIYGYLAAAVIFSTANLLGVLILLKAFKGETNIRFNETFLVKLSDFKFLIRTI
jgi:O-antigen/teichoic acid export membrane protein